MTRFNYGLAQGSSSLAPEAELQISNPDIPDCQEAILAVVDTGSCTTCIPENILESLDSLAYKLVKVRGMNQAKYLKMYTVTLKLGSETFHDIEIIASSKRYALIGRDIINSKRVALNPEENSWWFGFDSIHECFN